MTPAELLATAGGLVAKFALALAAVATSSASDAAQKSTSPGTTISTAASTADDFIEHAKLSLRHGRYAEAERTFRMAAAKTTDYRTRGIATCGVGKSLYQRSRFVDAVSQLQRGLEQLRLAGRPAAVEIAECLDTLGDLYRETYELPRAGRAYEEAYVLRRTKRAGAIAQAESLRRVAYLHSAGDEDLSAERLFRQVLRARRAGLQPDDPRIAQSINDLGLHLLKTRGPSREATSLIHEALILHRKLLGGRHPSIAASLNSLASTYVGSERPKRGSLYRRALEIAEAAVPGGALVASIENNWGVFLLSMGQVGLAQDRLTRAMTLRSRIFGEMHPDYATVLANLATLLAGKGEYDASIAMTQRAVAIREVVQGPDHTETLFDKYNLGLRLTTVARYSEARILLERVHRVRSASLGEDDPETLKALGALARIDRHIGHLDRAISALEKVVVGMERRHGPKSPRLIEWIGNLASAHLETGNAEGARTLYLRELALQDADAGESHPSRVVVLGNLSLASSRLGRFADAERYALQAVALAERFANYDADAFGSVLNGLASVYEQQGDYVRAEAIFQRALTETQRAFGPMHKEMAPVLQNLAHIYLSMRDFPKAEEFFKRSVEVLEAPGVDDGENLANALNNLSEYYRETGYDGKAEPLLRRALSMLKSNRGDDHPDTWRLSNNLASLLVSKREYGEAERLYLDVLQRNERRYGQMHYENATPLNNLGALYRLVGKLSQARDMYVRALSITEATFGPHHRETASMLSNLAILEATEGALDRAVELLSRAAGIEENDTARAMLNGSNARRQAIVEGRIGGTYLNVTLSLTRKTQQSIRLGVESVLQYKGRALDAIAIGTAGLRRAMPPATREIFQQLTDIAAREAVLFTIKSPNENTRSELNSLKDRREQLEARAVGDRSNGMGALAPVAVAPIAAGLPVDARLLEIFAYSPYRFLEAASRGRWDSGRYAAYIVEPSGALHAEDLGDIEEIDDLVEEFRTALRDPANTTVSAIGSELYKKLLGPLLPHLAGVRHLIVAPDGDLNLIPFGALVGKDGRYLLEDVEISYVTSGRDLLRFHKAPARQGAVIIANPDFGSSQHSAPDRPAQQVSRSFLPLAGSLREGEAVRTALGADADSLLSGTSATKDRLLGLTGPTILHIATHGFYTSTPRPGFVVETPVSMRDGNPLFDSGLALADANSADGPNNSGIVTAAELAHLDLFGTDLVTLSACESALGAALVGEGVYGMRRALVIAGAQSQVSTLWKVPDDETVDLMSAFYVRLKNGTGRSASLRSAQLDFISNSTLQHPYYWASFLSIGQWEPIN